jgi:hypothetical protein
MKKNYVLASLILFCCVQITNAQPYQSIFGDTTTQFNIFIPRQAIKCQMSDFDPELGEGYTGYMFFRKGNDTIINEQIYQIGETTEGPEYSYVREDTLQGKVYIYAPRCNEEYMICDMSLNIGDTFYFHRCRYNGTEYAIEPDGYMIADSITNIAGKKVIYFDMYAGYSSYPPYENNKVFFMEGVGSIFGPLEWHTAYVGGSNILLCIHKDEELVYIRNPESSYQCDYQCIGEGINEHTKNKLHIYPNPVFTEFHIQSDLINLDEVFIYTIQGQYVRHIKIQEEFQKINIAHLHAGIYLLKVKDTQGNIRVEKIVKL